MPDYQIGDYAETRQTFRLTVPERYNWAYDVFDLWARDPRKRALLWVGADGQMRDITFAKHIWKGYGQTETMLCGATFPGMRYKPGSMGVAAPGYEVAVVDDDGRALPAGMEGEVAIRARPQRPVGLLVEYWKNPEATERAFRGDWYYTGDRAARDDDGYFFFVGRADDVIISASYRIGPFEVESALIEHPAVAEAAVVASPAEMRGEIVKAFVVLGPGHAAAPALVAELQEHVRKVTAPYKYPREIEFVDDLPKTISGKIRRTELRQRELDRKRAR